MGTAFALTLVALWLAVRAGCDALCVGGGPTGPEIVDEITGALTDGVDGRRLAEAAGRVEALAEWRAAP